jgi:hypothetical protein
MKNKENIIKKLKNIKNKLNYLNIKIKFSKIDITI